MLHLCKMKGSNEDAESFKINKKLKYLPVIFWREVKYLSLEGKF